MKFEIDKAKEVLSRTPDVLSALLDGLSEDWLFNNEGGSSWSPFDVVGHLVYGEEVDWMARTKIILTYGKNRPFDPFDRFAQFELSKGKNIQDLLSEFSRLRKKNLEEINNIGLNETKLNAAGMHPELGVASLRQLLSAWTVHDLGHVAQIARTMARQYDEEVGPWKAYLGILK